MKLNINKACDLNSISVLPPHSRRSSLMSQASQIRSQSQSQFSQGMSLSQSQLSQSSFEENLMNEQRFGSQERGNSSKRVSSLVSGVSTRDESQLQLARTSSNVIKRWSSASAPGQVSEDFDNRFRQMEGSLNRMGMILDSIQNDVIQVKRAVKEVSLEMESVRQKIVVLDNSMGHVIKEERLKAFLDSNLKSISEEIMETHGNKLDEIASTISVLPKQMESQLVNFQCEVCAIVTEKIEVIANGMNFFNNSSQDHIQSPKKCCTATQQPRRNHRPTYNIMETATQQSLKNQMPMYGHTLPPPSHTRRFPVSKMETEIPKPLKPKTTGSNHTVTLKKEEVPLAPKMKDFGIIFDSDEESDGGVSCLLVKKETGQANYLIEEAKEETLRILRKARKRRRKQNNCVILD